MDARIVPAEPTGSPSSPNRPPRRDERERGRGIGSALVRFGLDRAARDGVIATLETARPENVPIYEHLGFRTYLETDAPGGGPHTWFMRADPA